MTSMVPAVIDFDTGLRNAFDTIRLFKSTGGSGWQSVQKISLGCLEEAQTVEQLRTLLDSHVLSCVEAVGDNSDWLLSIPPIGAQGFAVDLCKSAKKVRVAFGELEEEFESFATALTWIVRALSPTYQLRVTLIGNRPREWTLEPVAPNRAEPILAMGWFTPFRALRTVTHVIYRNDLAMPRSLLSHGTTTRH